MFRLYHLANEFILTRKTKAEGKQALEIVTEYLKFVNRHKNDEIEPGIDRSWTNKFLA